MFAKLFGKGGKDEPITTGEAIQKLRENEEMLMKKQDFLEKKVEAETATARKNAKTNKRVALAALKRKKRYEKQLQQLDGTLTTLEQQREALESANTNTAVFQVMKIQLQVANFSKFDLSGRIFREKVKATLFFSMILKTKVIFANFCASI